MRLNYNCVRDVLITLENLLQLDDDMSFCLIDQNDIINNAKLTELYSPKDIYYAIYNLNECGFIEAQCIEQDNIVSFYVYNITYDGHEFLSAVRDNKLWKKITLRLVEFGMDGIPAILSVASGLLDSFVK